MEEAIQQSDKTGNMKGGRAWAVVFVVFMAGFCMPANMGETMWVAPLVMQAYGFGPDVLGWVNGVFYILGAVIAFPAASFVRRLGIRWSVTIALACGIIGNIIGILAGDVAILMVSRIIQGAGFGLMGVIGVTAITPWSATRRLGRVGCDGKRRHADYRWCCGRSDGQLHQRVVDAPGARHHRACHVPHRVP